MFNFNWAKYCVPSMRRGDNQKASGLENTARRLEVSKQANRFFDQLCAKCAGALLYAARITSIFRSHSELVFRSMPGLNCFLVVENLE